MKKKIFILVVLLYGCSPSSLEDYHWEGENIAKAILYSLEKVESTHDLAHEGVRLKKEFARLTRLIIAASKYQSKHPSEEIRELIGFEVSEKLKKEFIRIYQIEGCQQVMEELQRESLHRLDLFHNSAN